MPKLEPMGPKAIAKRDKARARQKLKWYCQSCKKQCRDENGFKCHCTSEGHLRQLGLFGESPSAFVESYSAMFESAFLEHLQRTHSRSRVSANAVYNDYIGDRHHVHMNATKWATLTEFVMHLGKQGICKVDQTPKGWFIAYQGRKAESLLQESLQKKRRKADMAYEDREERGLLQQIERAAQQTSTAAIPAPMPSLPINPPVTAPEKVSFCLSVRQPPPKCQALNISKPAFLPEESASIAAPVAAEGFSCKGAAPSRKVMWISEGLVVKVMALNRHYKKKGVVQKVLDDECTAAVRMLDTGDTLHIEQVDLETVIPRLGALVRIVNGAYRGSTAELLSVHTTSFSAAVKLIDGGQVLPSIDYEDI